MTLCGAKSYEIRVQTGKGVESSANKFQFKNFLIAKFYLFFQNHEVMGKYISVRKKIQN